MLRARHAMLILVPALFTGAVACVGGDASQDTSDETNEAVEAEMTSAPPMIGTFRNEQSMPGIALLTLKSDLTFHLERAATCDRGPCPRTFENGWYKLGRLGTWNILTLSDQRTGRVEQYRYMYGDAILYLAPTVRYVTWWLTLPRSEPAWCAVSNDCNLQGLQTGPCAGQYYCKSGSCNYTCGPVTCEMDNTCPTM
jgi:hypothetical protein